jgi:pimeloyl-ACP methyl ester carboxylesterase
LNQPNFARSRQRIGLAARIALRSLLALALISAALLVEFRRSPLWVNTQLTLARYYLAGINGGSIELDGQAVHYVQGGSGSPVVLVHGLGGSAQLDWTELLPQLVRGGYHVYAMDLLGFGESAKPADRSYSIAEQAQLVVKFLDAMHLDRVALAGDSMGGWIASTVALNQSARISQLILFDSAGLTFTPDFDVSLFTPRTKQEVETLLAMLMPHPRPLPDYVKEDLIREALRDGWVIKRAVASMLTGADVLDDRLSALKIPLLIVWGKQDVLIPPQLGQAMHRMVPQSVLEIFDGCGHISVKTCAEQVGPMTLRFLDATTPQIGKRIDLSAAALP